ncbi:OmpW/AlkL family protein [Dyella lipolytica]|uniref:OmpW family protein n=1 Tax=Dyella lipolytica TaxID=1867835 RepID=A0ABW8J0N1_9GAMM|nr:OmpW family outer membrane protein [Dyella lipolytica]
MTTLKRLIWTLCFVSMMLPSICFADTDEANEWFVRMGALGALYHSNARIATPAGVIPGASADVSNNLTAIFEVGYNFTPNTFVMFMAGFPPRPEISGRGSINSINDLGAVTYGPAILTLGYRFPVSTKFHPYVGTGPVYAIILHDHDGAVSHLDVHSSLGYAVQAGVEYAISDKWEMYADVKQLWLSVNARGMLDGVVPVNARIQLNPTLVSVGIKFKL